MISYRHTGVVVESKWVVHGGVTGEVNQKENVEQPEFRMDAFSFDFRTSSWAHLPQLTSRDDSYPVEGHSGCIVSSEFSHTFYLLFGRRKATGTPQQAFVLDFFRPAAHLQVRLLCQMISQINVSGSVTFCHILSH